MRRFLSKSSQQAGRPIRNDGRSLRRSAGVAGAAGAAAGLPAGRAERPGAVCRPWRVAWGRPPAVESGLGPSAGHGERPGAVPAIPNQQAIIAGLGGLRGLRLSLKTLWWRWRWRRRRTHWTPRSSSFWRKIQK